jgi:hypothetical protein
MRLLGEAVVSSQFTVFSFGGEKSKSRPRLPTRERAASSRYKRMRTENGKSAVPSSLRESWSRRVTKNQHTRFGAIRS